MRFLAIIVLIISTLVALGYCVSLTYVANQIADKAKEEFWKKTWEWKSKLIKSWDPKTVYVSKLTRVWTPVEVKEFVPPHPLKKLLKEALHG